jgi:L-alanine-DL-glutamate epimerase-like enolase superfamily enzyme
MKIDRRTFVKSLALTAGALALPSWPIRAFALRLPVNRVTKIRVFYPPNYNANGPQAFPQSNMVVLVDTEAGITGIGQGGSPDTVRNVARSVIGKNAFDTEFIWQHAFMDGFYSPGKERLHALGAIDLALWDIKGKALKTPLYELFGGKARQHIELYATNGVPPGLIPQNDLQRMSLKERAAATMAAGYRVYRVDSAIAPSAAGGARGGARGGGRGGNAANTPIGVSGSRGTFNSRSRIREIGEAAAQIREGIGPDGDWMIDLHQSFI